VQGFLAVLAAAVAANATRSYSSAQLSSTAAAFAHFKLYHEPALQSICRAAARSLKAWPTSDVVSFLSSLESLRFRDEPFMRAAVKALTAAAEAGASPPAAAAAAAATAAAATRGQELTVRDLADSLAALLQLGFTGPSLGALLAATLR
jgi:hypothetical protein